jgi:peptidoglycan/xylan/chitin deacetylase (PgdA/CDA1 family)
MMCNEKYELQLQGLSKSKLIIENELGIEVKMFRAPNFSVNGDTIRALEKAGYSVDSSVLPGRAPRKWKIIPVYYDFRSAPVLPYYPSLDDVSKKGKSSILEIPITQNPYANGQPIGMGYLNLHGVDDTVKAIDAAEGRPIIFLIHPWEMINIGECYPDIKESWKKICSNNHEVFSELIAKLKKKGYRFTQIYDIEEKLRRKT